MGFSGGAAFAGGLLLDNPTRYAGAAVLHGTLPFDAGLSVATTRSHRDPGGHGITLETLQELGDWITERVATAE